MEQPCWCVRAAVQWRCWGDAMNAESRAKRRDRSRRPWDVVARCAIVAAIATVCSAHRNDTIAGAPHDFEATGTSNEEGLHANSSTAAPHQHHHHHHVPAGTKPHLVVDEAVVNSNREMEMTAADYLEEEHRRGGMCVRECVRACVHVGRHGGATPHNI